MSESTHELEIAHEVALARLGVAEKLSWFIAMFLGFWVGDRYGWILGLIAFAATYYFVTLPYRKKSDIAQDAYYKAANLGAYGYAHRKEQDRDRSSLD